VRLRMYQIGYGACVVLLLVAAGIATVSQRLLVLAIVPGVAFALLALAFRRKARVLSTSLNHVDVQCRLEYWDAPELTSYRARPQLLATYARMTPGTLECFLEIDSTGLTLAPGPAMRLMGLGRSKIGWNALDHLELLPGRGPLGNSLVLRFAGSGHEEVTRFAPDVDLAPTLAAAVQQSTNPALQLEIARPEIRRWQGW
jgi:hypothetical protein